MGGNGGRMLVIDPEMREAVTGSAVQARQHPCRAHTVRPVTGARYLRTINSKPGAAPCCYVRLPPAVSLLSQGQSGLQAAYLLAL